MATTGQIGPTVGYAKVNLEGGDNQFESADSATCDPPRDGCLPYETHGSAKVSSAHANSVRPGPGSDRSSYGK